MKKDVTVKLVQIAVWSNGHILALDEDGRLWLKPGEIMHWVQYCNPTESRHVVDTDLSAVCEAYFPPLRPVMAERPLVKPEAPFLRKSVTLKHWRSKNTIYKANGDVESYTETPSCRGPYRSSRGFVMVAKPDVTCSSCLDMIQSAEKKARADAEGRPAALPPSGRGR